MKQMIKSKGRSRRKKLGKRMQSQPREVCSALRRLLDTTRHVQARATEFEDAIHQLREKEQTEAIKRILKVLARSTAGDLTRASPDSPGNDPQQVVARAVMESLMEAFDIRPVRKIGEVISVIGGEPPASLELDRPLEGAGCSSFEIVSVGWHRNGKLLIKPRVRPYANALCEEILTTDGSIPG